MWSKEKAEAWLNKLKERVGGGEEKGRRKRERKGALPLAEE